MFIIDDIISWIMGKILDRFFYGKKGNEEIIRIYDQRLKEKDQSIENLRSEKEKHEKGEYRIIQSLKRRGISTDKLIERYDKPLNAILISYATQKEETKEGRYEESHFIKEELKNYNSKYLGGSDALIPPAKVPKWIKNKRDLQSWFEKEILKGRYCKLKFLVLFDIKQKVFWNSYVPYKQTRPNHFTIGEILDVEDIFTEEQVNKIALSEIIRDGDIAWLASSILSGNELEIIHKNQSFIEKKLENPSLRELSNDSMVNKLSNILSQFITNPYEVSKAIINEAKFWNHRLNNTYLASHII